MDAKNLQTAIEQNQVTAAFAKKERAEVKIRSNTRPKSTDKENKSKRKSGHTVGSIPKTGNTYERKAIYSVEDIYPLIGDIIPIELNGGKVGVSSYRLRTFKKNDGECQFCGLKGIFFALERDQKPFRNKCSFHLNLYAINYLSVEVMMTQDHIIPLSKGGKNYLGNLQTACHICNGTKGNKKNYEREKNAINNSFSWDKIREIASTNISSSNQEFNLDEIENFLFNKKRRWFNKLEKEFHGDEIREMKPAI